ncbi:MAG: hypothetical protein ACO3QA_09800 [Phycisphaerales bacterium]
MPRTLPDSGCHLVGLATAAAMLLAAPAVASTISATSWNTISSQNLSNASAGTLVQNGNTITVGYTTGLGNGGGGGTQLSGTTNLAVDWNNYNPTNALTTGTGQAVGALRIGFGTDNSGGGYEATNLQTITFSQAVVDPYIYMIYAQGGVVYDFSAYTTTVVDSLGVNFSVPAGSGAATGRTVTGALTTDSPNAGFILQLTGSFTQIQFNVDASGRTGGPNNPSNSPYASSQITIVAPLTAASSVPGAGVVGLATVGLAGISRRRRR